MSALTTTDTTDRADVVSFTPVPKRRVPTLLLNSAVVLGVAVLVAGVTFNWESYNQRDIAEIVARVAVIAGLTLLTGLNGQLSLGHSALMAVSAYTVALMQEKLDGVDSLYGWRILISIAVGVVAATVAGAILGVIAARLRGPYLAGATLALALIPPAIGAMVPAFKGDQGLKARIDPVPSTLEVNPAQWRMWLGLAVTAPVMILLANLVRSRYGRSFKAVRDDEIAAQLSGISVARTQVTAFTVSAVCAGVSGGLFALVYNTVNPASFDLNLSLFLVLAIVIGGLGSLWGAIWGAMIIIYLPHRINEWAEGLATNSPSFSRLSGALPLAVLGMLLVLVMLLARGGIQALVNRVIRYGGSLLKGRQSSWRTQSAQKSAGS